MSGQFRDSYHKCILLQSLQKKLLTEGISGQYKSTLKSEANDRLETYYHYDTICEMDLDLAKEAEMGMVKTFFRLKHQSFGMILANKFFWDFEQWGWGSEGSVNDLADLLIFLIMPSHLPPEREGNFSLLN